MILADTSVWIDHLRYGDSAFAALLDQGEVLMHPFVIGEVALGYLRRRELVLSVLENLPRATVASDAEVLQFINGRQLFRLGIGYVDAHLLVSVRLMAGVALRTHDARLNAVAVQLGLVGG